MPSYTNLTKASSRPTVAARSSMRLALWYARQAISLLWAERN